MASTSAAASHFVIVLYRCTDGSPFREIPKKKSRGNQAYAWLPQPFFRAKISPDLYTRRGLTVFPLRQFS